MRISSWVGGAVAAAAVSGALLGVGCKALSYYPYDCADLAECPGNNCPGECVPLPPLGFDGPALLWTGPEIDAPECPPRAPMPVYEGRADLDDSNQCPTCSCSPPECAFPSGITTSTVAMCQGPTFQHLDAPDFWNGTCASAAPPLQMVGSMSIEPVTERPCAPVLPPVPHDSAPPSWGTFGRACAGEVIDSVCDDPGKTCVPSAEPPPPGFRQCIMSLFGGEQKCPADYPDPFELFGDVEDTRDCTECECTPTAASSCTAQFSTFQDEKCEAPTLVTPMDIGAPGASCYDVAMPDAALGSMSAKWLVNQPGACVASGGVPTGKATALAPRFFCCMPPPGGS